MGWPPGIEPKISGLSSIEPVQRDPQALDQPSRHDAPVHLDAVNLHRYDVSNEVEGLVVLASYMHILRSEGNASRFGEDLKALRIIWHQVDLDMCHEDLCVS